MSSIIDTKDDTEDDSQQDEGDDEEENDTQEVLKPDNGTLLVPEFKFDLSKFTFSAPTTSPNPLLVGPTFPTAPAPDKITLPIVNEIVPLATPSPNCVVPASSNNRQLLAICRQLKEEQALDKLIRLLETYDHLLEQSKSMAKISCMDILDLSDRRMITAEIMVGIEQCHNKHMSSIAKCLQVLTDCEYSKFEIVAVPERVKADYNRREPTCNAARYNLVFLIAASLSTIAIPFIYR